MTLSILVGKVLHGDFMGSTAKDKLEHARNATGCSLTTLGMCRHCAAGDVPPWPQARTMRHHLLSLFAAPANRPGQCGAPSSFSSLACRSSRTHDPSVLVAPASLAPRRHCATSADDHSALESRVAGICAAPASPHPSSLKRARHSSDHIRTGGS